MPYWVDGWVEVAWEDALKTKNQSWSGVINLERLMLHGDDIANILFGLTKHPCDNPYFANRGVPKNCCQYVADEVKRNEEFIKQYGEGNIGHTYALWSEIYPHLDKIKQAAIDESSQWESIFGMVQELCKERSGWVSREIIKPEWIRFVVWGNW